MKRIRQRASYSRSRKGCDSCKRRHQKCDETWPTCLRCLRLGSECHWDRVPRHSTNAVSSDFKVLTPTALRIATLETQRDVNAFEYFHLYTLPTLRIYQPSKLWTSAIGYFGHRNSILRSIAIALGHQQRLLQTKSRHSNFQRLERDNNVLYCRALHSLRNSISTRFAEDEVGLALACLLLIILESLRNSPAGMLPHLKCGAHLLSRMKPSAYMTDEVQALSATLQAFCMSSRLFCNSDGYAGEFARVDQHLRVKRPVGEIENTIASYSLESSNLTQEIVRVFEELLAHGDTSEQIQKDINARDRVLGLQRRTDSLRMSLMHNYDESAEAKFQALCILASCHLSHALLDGELEPSQIGSDDQTYHFRRVVDLVGHALSQPSLRLATSPANTSPFGIGCNTIQLLDVTITICTDGEIRRRAFNLLDACPEREGMWRASVSKDYLRHLVPAAEESASDPEPDESETQTNPALFLPILPFRPGDEAPK